MIVVRVTLVKFSTLLSKGGLLDFGRMLLGEYCRSLTNLVSKSINREKVTLKFSHLVK